MGSQSCGSCQSIRQHWDELSFGTACTPVPAQALNPQCQHNPGARPFTAAVPEPPALSAGEPKGAEPEAAEELELGQGHELTSVQTEQSWAGLLDPLPAAETCAGFLPQRLFWDSGRSGSEELLATLRVTDMAFTPEGRGWVGFKSQWPGAEEPLTGSGALVPRWPWACSCHPHLQQVLGLELPMDPVCPQAGVPTTGLSPGTGNGPGETPGAALGSCPHHIWRPLTANLPCGSTLICRIHQAWWDNDANHPALPLWGQNRGGCAGGGDPHTVLLVHPHFTRCLLGAQSGLHSSCCNTEGLASQHHNGIHGSCKPLLREPKPAAGQGHSAFLGEGQGEAPGSLQRDFCTIFQSHCRSWPNQAQWVWSSRTIRLQYHLHEKFHGSPCDPKGRMAAAVLQVGDTAAGEGPRCARGEGMASRGNGTCSRRGAMLKNEKNHPCL